jgi:hypothetical protein
MFKAMEQDLSEHGFDQTGYVGAFISFGWNVDAPPPQDAIALLESFGAGEGLQTWLKSVLSPGSIGRTPASYILVGPADSGQGAGAESFAFSTDSDNAPAQLRARLSSGSVLKLPSSE